MIGNTIFSLMTPISADSAASIDQLPPSPAPEGPGAMFVAILRKIFRQRLPAAFGPATSVGVHMVLLVGLAMTPLLFPPDLSFPKSSHFSFVSPVQAPPYSPSGRRRTMSGVVRNAFTQAKLAGLSFIPKFGMEIPPPPEDVLGTLPINLTASDANVLNGIEANPAPVTAPVSEAPLSLKPIDHLERSRVVRMASLMYPALPKMLRIGGKVVVEAIIDQTGKVTQVRPISGPPLLVATVVKAVSEEKFTPTILDGRPILSELRVEVNFNLADDNSMR